jgi:hypothetical protein
MADAEIRAVARRHIRLFQKHAGGSGIAGIKHYRAAEMRKIGPLSSAPRPGNPHGLRGLTPSQNACCT